jgi:hypothetical protein
MEQLIEKKLTGAIMGIKFGTKSVSDALPFLERLQNINPSLAEDYERKLNNAVEARKGN